MVYAAFLLQKTDWGCFENCPGRVSLHFAAGSLLGGDLTAKVAWLGRSYESKTFLWPGYRLDLKGRAEFPCTMKTNNYLQCRVFNPASGIVETLGFSRI